MNYLKLKKVITYTNKNITLIRISHTKIV